MGKPNLATYPPDGFSEMVSRDIDDRLKLGRSPGLPSSHMAVLSRRSTLRQREPARRSWKEAATLSTLQWRARCPPAFVEPWNAGSGGRARLIFADSGTGRLHAVDFLPVAAASLDPAHYPIVDGTSGSEFGWPKVENDRNLVGYEAICVPGAVDGLGLALERFGRKTLAEVLEPSIRLADRGLPIDARASLLLPGLGVAVGAI